MPHGYLCVPFKLMDKVYMVICKVVDIKDFDLLLDIHISWKIYNRMVHGYSMKEIGYVIDLNMGLY